jgi:actin-related protein
VSLSKRLHITFCLSYFVVIQLSFPIDRGIIKDFDKMEEYLTYIFSQLSVKPEESIILLTATLSNPKVNREKITEIIFERFGASGNINKI